MLDFCEKKTGLPMSYVEMNKVGVAIAKDSRRKLICCLIIDKEDGREFGRLVAQMMLDEVSSPVYAPIGHFLKMYPNPRHTDDFSGFNTKISEVIWGSIHPILDTLIEKHRGVQVSRVIITTARCVKTNTLSMKTARLTHKWRLNKARYTSNR
eukprot:1393645-Amorphochlora_amoeboformis.AAC.3